MTLNKNHQALFALVRAGLWENCSEFQVSNSSSSEAAKPSVSFQGNVDWDEVYRLAEEQAVLGVVLAGIEHSTVKPPQEELLQWIGEVQMIEQNNNAMNQFIAKLVWEMRKVDIYTLLVKGQGVARCYDRPLWRLSGDVDLFLSENNYQKAKGFLMPLASELELEDSYYQHISMNIDSWEVELHGSLRSGLWKRLDRGIDKAQKAVFNEGQVRSWMCDGVQVFLPREDEDVVFVFAHILQHFFREGVGLRQICDWCRLLWRYKETINKSLLEKRLKEMGIMSEWRAFASVAVNRLGMPVGAMPFYSVSKRCQNNADKILSLIIENGSFGHNIDKSYYRKHLFFIRKCISFWRHTVDGLRFFTIFPLDSIKVWTSTMLTGISAILSRC